MAANFSYEYTEEVKWELFRHILYIIQGCSIVIFNALIIITIGRHEALRDRKEYISLAALALADLLNGLGTMCAGFYRIPVWVSYRDNEPASARFCLLMPHNILWGWFAQASHTMLVVVSVDRLLSVAIPLRHMSFGSHYMYGMISVAYSFSLATGLGMYAMNWHKTDPVHTKVCWTSYAYGMDGSYLRDTANAVNTMISVCIYICVPICYAYHNRMVAPAGGGNSSVSTNYRAFQKQLTKAVSISCMVTFLFVGLPWVVLVWMLEASYSPEAYEWIAVWMFLIANVNLAVNFFIYYYKQTHFKMGVDALFKNKTLPMDIDNWNTVGNPSSQRRSNNPSRKPSCNVSSRHENGTNMPEIQG